MRSHSHGSTLARLAAASLLPALLVGCDGLTGSGDGGTPGVSLEADRFVLAAPSCSKTISARTMDDPAEGTLDDRLTVEYSVADTNIVRLVVPSYRGWTYPRLRVLQPRAPGVTRLTVRYEGHEDVAVVQVYDARKLTPLQIPLPPGALPVPVGDNVSRKAELFLRVLGEGDCEIPGAQPTVTVADTSLVRVEALYGGGLLLAGKNPGDTHATVRYASLSKQVPIHARRMRVVPADTTLRVGQTFTYRFQLVGANGASTEVPVSGVHSFGGAASRSATTSVVTAVTPGASDMIVWSGAWEAEAIVRVVP